MVEHIALSVEATSNVQLWHWFISPEIQYTKTHLQENPEADSEAALRASMSRALQKNTFMQRIETEPWYTGCINELDEIVVTAPRLPKLDAHLNKKDKWWQNSIDLSFNNPMPEWRLPWFEDRVSGNRVWGSGGGNMKYWAHPKIWPKSSSRISEHLCI